MIKTGQKGLDLEERLRAYFWGAGYFALRGVPFEIDDLEVTDIDLWLYERPAAAARRRMIVDIKNKKRSKAVERLVWAKGLASILGVDNAIVAAKDSRSETEHLAKKAGVIFFGSAALKRIEDSKKLDVGFALTEEDLLVQIKTVDASRKTRDWMETFLRLKRSVLDNLGEGSLNKSLSSFCYFAAQAVEASPGSFPAFVATRLAHYAASISLLSLDFILANLNFSSIDDRSRAIENAVRFGTVGGKSDLKSIRVGLGLVSSYATNGPAVAAEIERKFFADADSINAGIISEIVRKIKIGSVFSAARELQVSAYSETPLSGENLSIESRSALGALLDFAEIDRRAFADASAATVSPVVPLYEGDPAASGQKALQLDPTPKRA